MYVLTHVEIYLCKRTERKKDDLLYLLFHRVKGTNRLCDTDILNFLDYNDIAIHGA